MSDQSFFPDGVIADALSGLGVEVLTEDGDELVALCPGHKERTGKVDGHPSWSINARSGVHFCFSCHYKGNLYSLVRDLKGVEAAKSLSATMEIHGGRLVVDGMEDVDLDPEKPTAEVVRTANFKPESWLDEFVTPPKWARDARRVSFAAVTEYEVRWNTDRDAWVLPLRDPDSLRLYGYQMKSQISRFFRNRPRDMKKSHTLFGWPAVDLTKETRVVVVESPLDAVLLSDYEVRALAICGSRVSDEQIELLQRLDWVVFWLDNDTAGKLETKRLREVTVESGIRADFITPDDYPDWEESEWKDVGEMPDEVISKILDAAGF